jgi:hypothetical protein
VFDELSVNALFSIRIHHSNFGSIELRCLRFFRPPCATSNESCSEALKHLIAITRRSQNGLMPRFDLLSTPQLKRASHSSSTRTEPVASAELILLQSAAQHSGFHVNQFSMREHCLAMIDP